jgi:tRNA A58 N-methylase Trm61
LQNFFRNEALDDRLGDLEIPESELDNYVEALERGRSLVAYFARPDTVEKITEIFRNANLMNVRAF